MVDGNGGRFTAAVLAALATGCAHGPTAAAADYPCLTPGAEWDGSLWWQRVQAYPGGFGGWFHGQVDGRGEPGKMNVYFLDPGRGIKSLHADHPTSIYNVMQGQYTILQLHSCLAALNASPRLAGLGSARVDESRNRIALSVEDSTVADSLLRIIERSNVLPREMVVIEKMNVGFIL